MPTAGLESVPEPTLTLPAPQTPRYFHLQPPQEFPLTPNPASHRPAPRCIHSHKFCACVKKLWPKNEVTENVSKRAWVWATRDRFREKPDSCLKKTKREQNHTGQRSGYSCGSGPPCGTGIETGLMVGWADVPTRGGCLLNCLGSS